MKAVLCITANSAANVRFGSKAEVKTIYFDVRFTLQSGHRSMVATAWFGEEHASRSEVYLSPNAGDKSPSNLGGIICIARKLYLKNLILYDSAIEQKRHAEDY